MKRPYIFLVILLPVFVVASIIFLVRRGTFPLLFPHGMIALQERNIFVGAAAILLGVAIPVVFTTFYVAWKYRDGAQSTYSPGWTGNTLLKLTWWTIPFLFVCIFSVVIWYGAHALDPYKPLTSTTQPIRVQVVALNWKWLFIYPDFHIATVNFLQFPVNTPVNFQLTADAPMNSFWIPSLGGQIYAMAAMETKLHLIGNTLGDFPGGAAEINGSGLAGMRFTVRVSTKIDFDTWITHVKASSQKLDMATYTALSEPSENTPPILYATVDNSLYNSIIMKYMEPSEAHAH